MIKTILFDFGNVLAFFDHERALRQLLKHTDQKAKQLRQLMYLDDLADRYECGQVTTDEVYAIACKHGGLKCTQAQFVHAFSDIFRLNVPIAELIPRLKQAGYRLVLASNTNDAHYSHYREQFKDLLTHFDAISVSHEAKARKPHEQFFAHTHKMAGCEKHECVFIDDLAENVAAAKAFGWHAVQLTDFEELVPQLHALGVLAS
ncbi:MAG: HAD family phosphatase [Gemmataceae bacterium]|nr:HAD family phosphatase [Gemmataceae bacterium]